MDDFSVQFPAQMEELRRRVQRDVRKNLRAAKHLLAAQVCFVLALVLVKQSLQHFTPAGFLAARALVSAPLIVLYLAARVDRDAGDAFFGGEKHSSARENTEARTSSTDVPFAKASPVTKERLLTLLNDGHVKWLGALVLLGQAFTALGLARVSVSNAVVLGQLVPVYACLIAVFQGVEKPSFGKFAAIGAGVLGAAVMLDPARMWLSAGNAFLLARAAAFACFLATQAPALHGARAAPAAVAASAQLVAAAAAIALGVPLAVFKSGEAGWARARRVRRGGNKRTRGVARGNPGCRLGARRRRRRVFRRRVRAHRARREEHDTRGGGVLQLSAAGDRAAGARRAGRGAGREEPHRLVPDRRRGVRRRRALHQRPPEVEAALRQRSFFGFFG
jgi:drug/metabolite transporter (DMT)-like permease